MRKQREHWGTQVGFIFAAVGSAVGLGTLWKFPYMAAANGGAAFILFYFFSLFFVGIPLLFTELTLGRRAQRAAVGVFAALTPERPAWRAVGWLGVVAAFVIMSFYSTIAGWGLNYALLSISQGFGNKSPAQIASLFDTMQSSVGINLLWHFAFGALTIAVVYQGVRKGVEYWSRKMTTTLFVILLILFGYCLTLDGFGEALHFLSTPDFSKLKPSSALEALGLAFFTLSLGHGVMLTYGSYMREEDDIPRTGLIVGAGILVVATLVAFVIFPILFTFGKEMEAGPGLVFQTLPILFSQVKGSLILSTTFFVLFVFTALTSAIAFVEVLAANCIDLFGWSRKKSVLLCGIACLVFGIPSALSWSGTLFANWQEIYGKTFFQTMDDLVTIWLIPICGLLTTYYAGWKVDPKVLEEEFRKGTCMGYLWKPWHFFIRYVAPIIILLILLQQAQLINIDKFIK